MKHDMKFYMRLFAYTFQLSAFTFGGGYVIVPLMKKQFVDKLGWIDEKEMLNFIAIAQSSPGVMAVNTSVLLGYHLAGVPGALAAILGTIMPPLLLLSIISVGYVQFAGNVIVRNVLRGMQAGVSAVIIDVVIEMGGLIVKSKKIIPMLLMVAAFIAVTVFHVNVALVILTCGVIGFLMTTKKLRKRGQQK